GILGAVEVQAGRQLVGEAVPHQLLGELDHRLDVGAGPRVLVGGQDVQRGAVDEEDVGVVGGDVHDRATFPGRGDLQLVLAGFGVGDRVTHIGDVDHVPHADPLPAQHTAQCVREHVGAHVAEVGVGVHGRPAGVHPGYLGGRDEVRYPSAQRVV